MNQVLTVYYDANSRRALSVTEIASRLNDVMTAYWDIFAARASLLASIENRLLALGVLEELKQRTDIDGRKCWPHKTVEPTQKHNCLLPSPIVTAHCLSLIGRLGFWSVKE